MLTLIRLALSVSVITLSPIAVLSSSADQLKVVATFSIIGDFAKNVGGDLVSITTLVGPDGDAHVYEARPDDVVAMSKADVVLVNGLHFEGFLTRLVEASATKAAVVELTRGVTPLEMNPEYAGEEDGHAHGAGEAGHTEEAHAEAGHDHNHELDHSHSDGHGYGNIDPHAFQSIANAKIYVANIADAFCAADAGDCATYKANAAAYTAKLSGMEAKVIETIASIPAEKRVVISSHDAFGYFEKAYGLNFHAPQGISTDSEASAADVAKLIKQIREEKAAAIFVESISDGRLAEQIANETGLKVGGTLYSDALSSADGPAATYLDMMAYNIATIKGAILGS